MPLLLIVSGLILFLMALVPGDVTESILGSRATSQVPPSAYAELRTELGLDRPLLVQYWEWLTGAVQGDLGTSLVTHEEVSKTIKQRFPVTLSLTVGALLLSITVGVSLGVASAVRGGALGRMVDVLAMAGWVVPVYWLAAQLIVIFAVELRWLPATGYVPLTQSPTEWFRSLILPVVALSVWPIAAFAKFTREAMLDSLSSEYVRMAKAAGIPPASIVFRHAFGPASLQVVTLAGLLTVGLLIGTVFVEQVFALPGLGGVIVGGTIGHDVRLVQGVAVFFTVIVVVVNLLVDLAYSLLNPKVRTA